MSQQLINIGNAPNDGSGDSIRVSFNKVNNNFTELFALKNSANKLVNGPFTIQLQADGTLKLPANGSIKNTTSAGFSIIALTNAAGQTNVAANLVTVILNDPVQAAAIKASPTNFEIVFNGGLTAVITGASGNTTPGAQWTLIGSWPANPIGAPLTIRNRNYVEGTNGIRISTNGKDWTFGNNGKLKLPVAGDIVDSNNVSVLGGGGGGDFDFGNLIKTYSTPVSYLLNAFGINLGSFVPSIDLGAIFPPSSQSINFGTFAPTIDLGSVLLPNYQSINFGTFLQPNNQSIDLGSVAQPNAQSIDLGSFVQVNDLSIDLGTF
jgi:hypothetical protein